MTITNAQIEEAKRKISEEFMEHFYTFIEDAKAFGTTYEFGRKYGIYFRNEEMVAKRTKANLTNIVWFQSNIFGMRRYPQIALAALNSKSSPASCLPISV